MYSKAEMRTLKAKFEDDDVLRPYANHLILAHQWVALDRDTAVFAVEHMDDIMAGVETIMKQVGGHRQQGCEEQRWLDLAPDEYWLTVLAKLWFEKKEKLWGPPSKAKANVGTLVAFPPSPQLAARLKVGLGLEEPTPSGPAPLCVDKLQGKFTIEDCKNAWKNTEALTKWEFQHPITFKARQLLLLWVIGSSERDTVVCGSLETMLELLKERNDLAFKANNAISFMMRKVGSMSKEDAEWFTESIKKRLGL